MIDKKEISQTVDVFKIIAEENRLSILHLLKKGELCVCKIFENLNLSQSLTSHHLKTLKDAGLIVGEKRGLWVYYSLTKKGEKIISINFN